MFTRLKSRWTRDVVHSNPVGLEPLEDRYLLAGNVIVNVAIDTGALLIIGDGAANSILISTFEDAQNGTGFRIQGQNKSGATLVNGNTGPVEFFNVPHLGIDLQGGDDYLAITNNVGVMLSCLDGTSDTVPSVDVHVPGVLTIAMGEGNNQVDLGSVTTNFRMLVEGGGQNDLVRLCGADVGTNLTVRTFGGADSVFVRHSQVNGASNIRTANGISNVAVDGVASADLFVIGGNDSDDVSFNGLAIDDDLTVQGFLGSDVVDMGVPGSFPWDLGAVNFSSIGDRFVVRAGDDQGTVDLRALNAGTISIVMGVGNDLVRLRNVSTTGNLYVNTLGGNTTIDFDNLTINTSLGLNVGSGNDLVTVSDTQVGTNASISTLGGADDVNLDNVDVGVNLSVLMGDGLDDLSIDASSATKASLVGGAGSDRYFSGINSFGSENISQFEVIN